MRSPATALNLAAGSEPFVLLDDVRASGAVPARLFRNPDATLTARTRAEVPALLDAMADAVDAGHYVAGYLAYEAGQGLANAVRRLDQPAADAAPSLLGWFGIFSTVERVPVAMVPELLPDPDSAWIGGVEPDMDREDYLASVRHLLDLIAAGDIYQVNLTFRAQVATRGHPLAVYARLRQTARAGYGGFIWTGSEAVASLSPELFFTLRGDEVMARPMKGTALRWVDSDADARAASSLALDPKQRAENLMIVDLIRNDLSRVAVPGSVEVPDLFRVETFPTIHQLVSDVRARVPKGKGAVDVLRAAFPCGSITGAPKVRAMEIIDELERASRGIYTGSIGFVEPGGDAAFNVAIRTLVFPATTGLHSGPNRATLGLGSGIVADSQPAEEWRECLAKGEFVTAAGGGFDLIETMYFDPIDGVQRLEGHLARLKASAEQFGFGFDRHSARNSLQAVTFRLRAAARVRMRLAPRGALAIEVSPVPRLAELPVPVAVRPMPIAADDFRVAHKTSLRAPYDAIRRESCAAEVIFVDDNGFVTEGSWTNIFVERDDHLLTPPVSVGLLPGVLRAELIEKGRAVESHLRLADLDNGFFIGNSLRGLMPARLQSGVGEMAEGAALQS